MKFHMVGEGVHTMTTSTYIYLTSYNITTERAHSSNAVPLIVGVTLMRTGAPPCRYIHRGED